MVGLLGAGMPLQCATQRCMLLILKLVTQNFFCNGLLFFIQHCCVTPLYLFSFEQRGPKPLQVSVNCILGAVGAPAKEHAHKKELFGRRGDGLFYCA